MLDLNPASWFHWLQLHKPEAMSDTALLLLGVLFGLIAKNIYSMLMRSFGFVGGFMSRLAVGWFEEMRRETPNVVDFAMVAMAEYDDCDVLMMDALIGPRRLSDVYLNPRVAIGIRMQTFSITEDVPWVRFRRDEKHGIAARLIRRYRHWRYGRPGRSLTQRDRQLLRVRRAYAPIENLVSQYLTNQWAGLMAISEPCHVFHFVVALVYEKNADIHMDRHFHALVIWEELLLREDFDRVITYHPEFQHRWDTIRRISAYYRSSPEAKAEFGSLTVVVPKRNLVRHYSVNWVINPAGNPVPVSRPVAFDFSAAEEPTT